MSMTDPIADMLTRIRNAQMASHKSVHIPMSKIKLQVAKILEQEGYIVQAKEIGNGLQRFVDITLKYVGGNDPVIGKIKRESKPGRRIYVKSDAIPRVLGGMGLAIISTSKGIMSGREARRKHLGGELICSVY